MKYLHEEISKEITTLIKDQFENVLIERIDKSIEFFNSVIELRESFPDYDENAMIVNTENAKTICDNIKAEIDANYKREESENFDTLFPILIDDLTKLFTEVKPSIVVEQFEERFKPLSTDKRLIKGIKRTKNFFLQSQQLILKVTNSIRVKVKKQPVEINYWNQQIPLQNVTLYFLRNKLLEKLSEIYEEELKQLSQKSVAIWNYDESYDEEYILNFTSNGSNKEKTAVTHPETVIAELESRKNEINKKLLLAVEECVEEFDTACEKVGTIELSKSKFNSRKISNHLGDVKNDFEKIIKEFNNTLHALGEDWELNYDLESIRYSAIEVYLKFGKSLSVKNNLQIYPHFNEISSSLNSVNTKLKQPTNALQDFERLIVYSKDSLQKVLLSSTLPNLINSISDLKLQEMISEAKRAIKNEIRSIVETRAFVESTTYDNKIKSSDIDEIFPREFISFNTLPKLLSSLDEIKEDSSIETKNIQSELINLGNMADFTLESAITAAIKEGLSLEKTKEIALDGIKMSQEKRDQLLDSFNSLCDKVLENLRRSVAVYCEELYSLTESSKIIEIKVQLAKAKAKAKVKETRGRLFLTLKKFAPKILNWVILNSKKLFSFYSDTRKQFGLADYNETIDSEISDFLSRANHSLENLPYIYRRLFQLLPLENDRLYVSREQEESELDIAYKSWLNSGYAPVIVSAEKGGGITSFLNIFNNKFNKEITAKRLSIQPTVSNEAEFLKILQDIFLPERFLGFEDFIKYLNKPENKQAIIVENLQHLYLRRVKGFVCLKLLTDIIAKTNKNIFWVTSTTLYANEYLARTIRLNDIFGYRVVLKQLKSNQIIDLIKKRNSISGYNIVYQLDPAIARKKEINKFPFAQQQNILEKQFFNSLNKFAQSNVSLALLFWLRAIKEIKEKKVYINADLEISDTILNSLSSEKIFILQALILHDGMRVSDLTQTINSSLNETYEIVQILYDDGVLIKNDDVFLINPLLYRQSVVLLKSKNLL